MGPYLRVFLATAGAVAVATPIVRRFSIKVGAIDKPSDRKVHPKPTPTLGGLGILVGVAVGLGVASMTTPTRALFHGSFELPGTLIAAVIITGVGLVDDLKNLSAPAKVAGQVLAAGFLVLNGVQLLFFWFPTQGIISLGSDLAVPLTVAWVLIMVNAVNLVDGLDGLAAGIVAIAAAAFFIWVYSAPPVFGEPASSAALLSAIVAGACVGFLPYNFYPARIFMGDSGSMLLGLLLAAATVAGVGRTIQPSGGDIAAFSIPILIPVFVLAIPLMDVAMAVVRRVRRGRPVFAPDKEHIHHQLREIGHTHRQAVLIMYFWSILLAGSGLAVSFINGRALVSTIMLLALGLIAATYLPRRIRESRRPRAVPDPEVPEAQQREVGSKPA
jgi:UDP-GlcNAc:undecaprenyl-phosphate/decaprenyl-phosphate GlcNAc-1-phosphate transferase